MTQFNHIAGVIFDLDGVITDTAQFHTQAWQALATKLGVTWDVSLQNGLKGLSRMDSLALILQHGQLTDHYSLAEKKQLAAEKNTHYLSLIQQLTPDDIFPGIRAFLDELQTKGYKISLASASKNAPTILRHLQLTDYFEKIVDPATLTHGKPDPEIFLRAAEIINLQPDQCLALEDATAGIAGINAAGETSLGVGDPNVLSAADIVFSNTADITLANIQHRMTMTTTTH